MAVTTSPAITGIKENIFGFENLNTVLIDGTAAAWNTVDTHEVFTVTGGVIGLLVFSVRTTVASAGAAEIAFGRQGSTGAYSAAQVVTNLVATTFVAPGSTSAQIIIVRSGLWDAGTLSGFHLNYGLDIGYEVTVAALNAGLIEAKYFWSPLTADATVVNASGAAL